MPQLNLNDVTGHELRQLLDSSRRQGDAALSYRILQEMAARRRAPAGRGLFKTRRPAEPRTVEVAFSDPLETDEIPPMPAFRLPADVPPKAAEPAPAEARPRRKRPPARTAPAPVAPVAATPAKVDPLPHSERPLSLRHSEPPPSWDDPVPPPEPDLRFTPPQRPMRAAPRGISLKVAAGFVLGIGLGTVVGWSVALLPRDPPPPTAAAPVQTAALALPPAPVAALPVELAAIEQPAVAPAPDLAPETAAEAPAEPATSEEFAAVQPTGAALELPAPTPLRKAAPPPEMARAASDHSALASANPCAGEPSPADRAICGDAKLRRLQGELRQAYADALAAHEDRGLLRERQLAWRDARNTVTDPGRLATLYEARIRKLNAAAAEARRQR